MRFKYFIKGFITFSKDGGRHKVYAFAGNYYSAEILGEKIKDDASLSIIGGKIKANFIFPEDTKDFPHMDTLITDGDPVIDSNGDPATEITQDVFQLKLLLFNVWGLG